MCACTESQDWVTLECTKWSWRTNLEQANHGKNDIWNFSNPHELCLKDTATSVCSPLNNSVGYCSHKPAVHPQAQLYQECILNKVPIRMRVADKCREKPM